MTKPTDGATIAHTLDVQAIAGALKVLADTTRLRIFVFLRSGEACVCEIAGELNLAENLVSHHLGVLRREGIVRDRRDPSDARWVYYQLDPERLTQLAAMLGEMFESSTIGARTPTCGPAAAIPAQWSPRPARRSALTE